MSKELVIGLDVGTGSVKALAVDREGQLVGQASRSYALYTPEPGAAEQDADEVTQACLEALADVASQVTEQSIAGVAISAAMHTLLPIKDGQAIAHATIWADTRAQESAQALQKQASLSQFARETGCGLHYLYHPARLRHLAATQPEVFDEADHFIALRDYVVLKLTGRLSTDHGLASSTGLLNLHTQDWHDASLELAGIRRAKLPELTGMFDIVGKIQPEVFENTPSLLHCPVIAGSSDGALSNIGAGNARLGELTINVGTSGAIRLNQSESPASLDPGLWCYLMPGQSRDKNPTQCMIGGAVNNAGLALQWLARQLGIGSDEELTKLIDEAGAIEPGSSGLTFLPYLSGERSPHWLPNAKASWHGLSLHHGPAHLTRSVLEAVCFTLADVHDRLRQSADLPTQARLTGGITQSPVWMQMLADILNLELLPTQAGDASARGAAMLGHVALGHVNNLSDFPPPDASQAIQPQQPKAYQQARSRFQAKFREMIC